MLTALMAGAAAPALANAPTRSLQPPPRPTIAREAARVVTAPAPEALIDAARLGGRVGFLVADAASGNVLEAHQAEQATPPASVVKALTSAYALETLGASHRFQTRLVATGPIRNGQLQGDLILVGGGDPVLASDGLGDMAIRLRDMGLRSITGRFIVHGALFPAIPSIDPDQPDHVGYNPAISAINLNFNRVHFQWQRSGGGYQVVMDAPDTRFRPPVTMARMRVVDRQAPVYSYSNAGGLDEWSVAAGALGNGGSRWLPVRQPEVYAGDVFRNIANFYSITLPPPQVAGRGEVRGTVLVERSSDTLRSILQGMMQYSTNLTAEVVGLSASAARGSTPGSLAQSGRMMADWARARFGMQGGSFDDHSGLSGGSRIAAADMVRFLVGMGPNGTLRGLMRDFPIRDRQGNVLRNHPLSVHAKTGTLNFVSGLGGYVATPSGRDLAFAIFAADLATRDRIPTEQRERPPGGSEWLGRARRLQQDLIDRWGRIYG